MTTASTQTVVRVATRGVDVEESGCSGAIVTVAAGENWDALVARAVEEEWGGGIECLAGIPGLVGATPIQNVGAYGSEVSQLIASVRTWDRVADRQATFAAADCGFAFRTSRFKADPDRYLIVAVTFQLPLRIAVGARSATPSWPERWAWRWGSGSRRPRPARLLSICGAPRGWCSTRPTATAGAPARSSSTRSWSPIARPSLPDGAPRFRTDDGRVKTSAAWLIEQSGFGKGYGRPPATCPPSTRWP